MFRSLKRPQGLRSVWPGRRPAASGSREAERGRRRAKPRRQIGADVARRRRARFAALLSSLAGLGLCALAGCALFVPGFALGAEQPATTTTLTSPEDAASIVAGAPPVAPAAGSGGLELVTLPWGDSDGQVGLESPGEGLTRGPEALAIAPDGRIAILDSVNRRVVVLDREGAWTGTIPVTLAAPRFLAADDCCIHVLDCDADRRLLTLTWEGASLADMSLPALDDVVTGLFATVAGPCVEVAHGQVMLLSPEGALEAVGVHDPGVSKRESAKAKSRTMAGRPLDTGLDRVAKATFSPQAGLCVELFKMDADRSRASQIAEIGPALARGRAVEHLVSVDGDVEGGLIVGMRLVESDAGPDAPGGSKPSLMITKLDAEAFSSATRSSAALSAEALSTEAPVLFLADPTYAYVGTPYVVAPDGRICQPLPTPEGYSIVVHTFLEEATR